MNPWQLARDFHLYIEESAGGDGNEGNFIVGTPFVLLSDGRRWSWLKRLTMFVLSVDDGEWIAIVGHNGSGKSTMAKLMIGLLFPEDGVVSVFREKLTKENIWDIRSRIRNCFSKSGQPICGSTVQDDVAFALENNGIPFEEMVKRVHESLSQVKMSDFLDRATPFIWRTETTSRNCRSTCTTS